MSEFDSMLLALVTLSYFLSLDYGRWAIVYIAQMNPLIVPILSETE